jgi:pimeloyl-ACP methyl ester carboxylesterase
MCTRLLFLLVAAFLLTGCASRQRPAELARMSDMSYPFPVRYAALPQDITVGYMDEGRGERTLLFVHGLGSYAPAWLKNIEDLKKDYRCIAMDLPGYGHSSKADYPGDMTFYAGVIADLIRHLKIEPVTLVGHSMGGQIAMVTALGHPDLVSGLVLVAPAGFETFHKGQKQWFREVFTPDMVRLTPVEAIRNNYATNFYRFPRDAEFMINDRIAIRSAADFRWYCDIIPKNVRGMVDQPVHELLPEISQPVLTIFGQNDNLIPNRYLNGGTTEAIAHEGSRRIPNSLLVMIPKAGHFVQFEKSDQVNKAIRGFLGK